MQDWYLQQIMTKELQQELMREARCVRLRRQTRCPGHGVVDRFLTATGALLVDAGERLCAT